MSGLGEPGHICSEPSEAEKMLPLVRLIASDIRAKFSVLRSLSKKQHRLVNVDSQELRDLRRQIGLVSEEIEHCMAELQKIGLELIDMDTGEVSFPAVFGGNLAEFLWEPTEEHVHRWRRVNETEWHDIQDILGRI